MINAVLMKTHLGIKIIGSIQMKNGKFITADWCFQQCNKYTDRTSWTAHPSTKLLHKTTTISMETFGLDRYWYKDRNNFLDITVNYECNQMYIELNEKEI